MKPLTRTATLTLNVAHALDHLFLLIFATAVAAVAQDFGFDRWEDLMPYSAGAFVLFGLGSVPAGRLGDSWGRRNMMLVFFGGVGASALLAACAANAWQLALALTLLGAFCAIYHPVGIPMIVQGVRNPGAIIGMNGLAGNMGVAAAALLTGFLVRWVGWRAAFAVPGLVSIACGFVFARCVPGEAEPPAARTQRAAVVLAPSAMVRVLVVMTVAAATGNMLFNFATSGNTRLLAERLEGLVADPAALGALLAAVYALASFAQVLVGRLIDRFPMKPLYLSIVLVQVPLLAISSGARGWWHYAGLMLTMVFVFGAIPFIDTMVVRYVDDRMRSRVAGLRMGISFGISSLAVWLIGPVVKIAGFQVLWLAMAGLALATAAVVSLLPPEPAPLTAGR